MSHPARCVALLAAVLAFSLWFADNGFGNDPERPQKSLPGEQNSESFSPEAERQLRILEDDRLGPQVRNEAARELARLRDKAATIRLVRLLQGGKDAPEIGILSALAAIGDSRCLPALREIDRSGKITHRKTNAALSYAILMCEYVPEEARALLETAENYGAVVEDRVKAVRRLGELRDPRTVNRLLDRFGWEELHMAGRGSLYKEIAVTLGKIGHPKAAYWLWDATRSQLVPEEFKTAIREALANCRHQLPWYMPVIIS
jgi:HEAT repeat protein